MARALGGTNKINMRPLSGGGGAVKKVHIDHILTEFGYFRRSVIM